ncbi:MAG TPA: DUF362 domain-containing protein [Phycisphaerae bacterium]|nr:DUF362 domain-containing protein [Phycisphaerae bacterium]
MGERINRREMLARGLCTAGMLAAGASAGLPLEAAGAQTADKPKEPPDRSDRAPTAPVAIQRCESFGPQVFRKALDKSLDLIGGIDKLVRNKTVAIKVNLTGMSWDPCFGLPAYETYQTHPNTVAALCAALSDAGARRIVIVENLYWRDPFEKIVGKLGWDVKGIQSAGGQRVSFEDTRNRGAFRGYSRFKVPWGGYIYPAFDLNERFEKTDVLVSLSKLKQHACAGVTMTVKNMFGATPCSLYGNNAPDEEGLVHRTEMFHAGKKRVPDGVPAELDHGLRRHPFVRVPRIVADVYGARPVDLAIVDGIRTLRGGEGHWNRGIGLVEPKLLLAGRNGVCTDAVGTAVMGFDPKAPHGTFPFQGDNHLRLLASVGVGSNDPGRIEVAGVPLKEAVFPFRSPPSAKE